ncbi:hypothetical protein [Xylanibacter oryzae]|uniref:hypothetical protein n=1 Tax=Xylanibacter oryzae TaxID=185293 RepID=UPI00056A90F6|nr:hypothetical protein [Xylanibacter oryzae]
MTKTSNELILLLEDNAKINQPKVAYRDYEKHQSNMTSIHLITSILDSLITEKKVLVTSYHYRLLFQSYNLTSNFPCAEKYILLAIENSKTDKSKVENLNALADFYYNRGRFQDGEIKYKESLNILPDDLDDNTYTNGCTYVCWYVSMTNFSSIEAADIYYKKALECFLRCKKYYIKKTGLDYLEYKKNQLIKSKQEV